MKGSDGQSNSSSWSPLTKSSRDGTKNSLKRESGLEAFWVLTIKSGRREKVQDLQPSERRSQKERPYNSLLLLADARERKKDVYHARCSSEANLRGSKGGLDKQLRTRDKFKSGGRTSRGRHDFSKLRNIRDTTVPAARTIPVKENTKHRAGTYKLRTWWRQGKGLGYLRDKHLEGIDTPSITPVEKPGPREQV